MPDKTIVVLGTMDTKGQEMHFLAAEIAKHGDRAMLVDSGVVGKPAGEAAVDIFIYHAGITAGGSTGYDQGSSLEDMVERTQENFRIARAVKPDVILLAHGAALVSPDDARYILAHTDADGVQLGSSIERLAIEGPLQERTRQFKRVPFARV